ncbi:MAG: response regulator transcription factor [Verrucomicrobia bacterium]|nr:response regulator transcription factor [Verrucomicrobiota bacterium]MDA1067222.1 response regulator transcription factor [Verrucomicrobiota bacterium]
MKVLIIEDSQRLLRSLTHGLKKQGFSVDAASDGRDGLDFALFNNYDVILLDLMLPGIDGLTILRKLRASGKQTHILILSASDQVDDRIRGLRLGADDYMIKPFSFDELIARIQTLVRRKYEAKSPEVSVDGVIVNTANKEVTCNGNVVTLTPGEYAILEHLMLNRGRVLSKDQLLDAVHDSESYASRNVIEVLVCNLRKKLDHNGNPSIIKTKRGYGYLIDQSA